MLICQVSQQSSLSLPFKVKELKTIVQNLLEHKQFSEIPELGILSLVFLDDDEMKKLNHQYRQINQTTDVLSFPLQEKTPEGYLFGELAISLPKAFHDAKELNITPQDELIRLIVHGLTHLLGYDHETIQQEKVMQKIESDLFYIYHPMEDHYLYE